jgi:hypothetical protein
VLKEKPKVSPIDNLAFNEVIGYDLDGTVKWSFKDETITYPQVLADLMYINHGSFYSKIRLSDGGLIWKKSKPANSHNAYHFFVNDKEGNDYWIYSKDYGVETKIDFISKSTLATTLFFEYQRTIIHYVRTILSILKTKHLPRLPLVRMTLSPCTAYENTLQNASINQHFHRCKWSNKYVRALKFSYQSSNKRVQLSMAKMDKT